MEISNHLFAIFTGLWSFCLSQRASKKPALCGSVHLSSSDVSTCLAERYTASFLRITQQDCNWNSLLPEDKYLNGICMWVEVDLWWPSWFVHLCYEATETLENIPVRATLISAVAYLLPALTGGVDQSGGSSVYTVLCSVKPAHNHSRITVTATVLHTWVQSSANYAKGTKSI